jgi:hypothetical protein
MHQMLLLCNGKIFALHLIAGNENSAQCSSGNSWSRYAYQVINHHMHTQATLCDLGFQNEKKSIVLFSQASHQKYYLAVPDFQTISYHT